MDDLEPIGVILDITPTLPPPLPIEPTGGVIILADVYTDTEMSLTQTIMHILTRYGKEKETLAIKRPEVPRDDWRRTGKRKGRKAR